MRTTIELNGDQHAALVTLARQRGMRGFSQIVQEALDAYLSALDADELEHLLSLEGSLDENDEREMRDRIGGMWTTWRAS